MNPPLLTVTYTGEPDVVFEYPADGQLRRFGRDEDQCDIVVWSAINSRELSRVAGCIWRMGDELWLRNLSTRHDLFIVVPGRPTEPPLPARLDDGVDRGAARTIPAPRALIRGPGGCELLVRQERDTYDGVFAAGHGDETVRVSPVPAELRPTAIALCEPLLQGAQLPASYSQIAERTGSASVKKVRNDVARLCNLYADEVPAVRERIARRMDRELAALDIVGDPRLRGGVWTFDGLAEGQSENEELARRRALALPDYFEIAHLLVRRHLISIEDVDTIRDVRSS